MPIHCGREVTGGAISSFAKDVVDVSTDLLVCDPNPFLRMPLLKVLVPMEGVQLQ